MCQGRIKTVVDRSAKFLLLLPTYCIVHAVIILVLISYQIAFAVSVNIS
jgi:hypothetical protein